MTYIYDDPKDFPADSLRGYEAAFSNQILRVHGGVVRTDETPKGEPALVVGGGSGHYPAFAGWVGYGIAHGAPCGNIFASPSSEQVYSVAKNAENGGGVILGFGNYAGDVLHFGVAAEKLRAEGIDVRIVKVSDDIASNTPDKHRDRRGIAGDLPVFKITGAAIAEGADLDTAEAIAWKANDATRSLGVAFDGCTLPGAEDALFHVPEGQMAVGLGIHGEPGVEEVPLEPASELARRLVDGVLKEHPEIQDEKKRIAVVLNGLGTVKYEELFLLYGKVAELLSEAGYAVVGPEVSEHVTSLDMAGVSLTVVHLDDELERLWLAPANTPAFQRGEVPKTPEARARNNVYEPGDDEIPEASAESVESARRIADFLQQVCVLLEEKEEYLGRIDSVAGDGDHGNGMVLGAREAVKRANRAVEKGAGARTVLVQAGAGWSNGGGGTSGALWGALLTAVGSTFSDSRKPRDEDVRKALVNGVDAIVRLGGAQVGDKTMVCAAVPYANAIKEASSETSLPEVLDKAAQVAESEADATKNIKAALGRARVLKEKSVGTPDPGAISFALISRALSKLREWARY
ncbi:dihydroxyacetone kinase family protein [Dermabacter sp. Marseille-Q3180]|uniref:dihydroxyacetone kinase family protein n=1 Tax=Dermabacter sp. Marseille-Q3180 TaxID=2758090 RepID=UPI0020246FC6|nr:dihydroxyacetone kinase family protein [Dermabacter sp. Marseille-Q3180]